MSDLPTTAAGVLRLMPSTATSVAMFSKQLIQSVHAGEVNPLELIVQLHALTKVYEEVREEIEENVLREADKFPERVIERYGARIEKAEVGTKYNYLKTGDLEYEELHAEAETANRKLKEREALLRALKEPQGMVSRHGEPYTANPPFKTSKAGFKIYLANIK